MRKIAMAVVALFATVNLCAQNKFPLTGNVGVGTENPQAVLDVGKSLGPEELGTVLGRLEEGGGAGVGTYLGVKGYYTQPSANGNYPNIKSFAIEHSFYGVTNSSINFFRGGAYSGGFITFNTDDNTEKMRIFDNGNVGIGTINPQDKLAVNGNIHAREIKVDVNGWPDYVFRPNYDLASLEEVKAYIEKHQHLPEMPSEKEIAEKGLSLGEMNKLLTKKVEELTLYLIEKDNQLKEVEGKQKAQAKVQAEMQAQLLKIQSILNQSKR